MTSTILSSEFHSAGALAAAASRPQRRNRGGSGGGGGAGLSGQVKKALAQQQQADKRISMSPNSKKAGEESRGSPGAAKSGSSLLEWDAIFSIFSHVVGALLFLSLPYHIFHTEIPPRYAVATTADIVVCSIYFGGVAICFTLSTIFHTFMSHSPPVYARGMQLDFQGILLLMWGSTVPLAYYNFDINSSNDVRPGDHAARDPVLARHVPPGHRRPAPGPRARAALFAAFGVGSFLVPLGHGAAARGWDEQGRRLGLPWIGATVVCNGVGVVMYAFKIPEKWHPKVFDIFGASHQIMHIMVVFAALAYSQAVLAAFDYRHSGRMDVC
ncbi:hypothetical protein PG997_015074 [Apiospora hydei]|uniref:Uncharacterized protein n=1 Tax=Apiospora hydei TaxID=1337664 RepID=A0ABR1UWD0_9PEZI